MSVEHNLSHDNEAVTWRAQLGAIVEPDRPGYVPWEATPGKTIARVQTGVDDRAFMELDSRLLPPYINPEDKSYVANLDKFVDMIQLSDGARRDTKNSASYASKLVDAAGASPELQAKLARGELGTATMPEVFELINGLGMESAELARLTHPYGYRLEYLEAMRREAQNSIIYCSGQLYDNPDVKYKIIALDTSVTLDDFLSMAIAMKRTNAVGWVGDTDVYERSTFIVRLDDASHFDQAVAKHLKSIPAETGKNEMMQYGRLEEEAKRLLAADDIESVIPISTTVYAVSMANHARLVARQKQVRLETRENFRWRTPDIQNHLGILAINQLSLLRQ